ncbi:MAG TPA: NAD-dependent epimerase/dehydratase family protein [Stellaceae bacterium]|nr:NAD-dependent epimerase/dehydratase family protein [Stellaceae bacterium]
MTAAAVEQDRRRPVLITGGAGFIGTNLADRLLRQGRRVLIYDSLGRAGAEQNLRWLRAHHGARRLDVEIADVLSTERLRAAVADAGTVFHLAGQVAVTTSLDDPWRDFATNAGGTLTLLEALRHGGGGKRLVFTSTNKVYGAIGDIDLAETATRYTPEGALARRGIDEGRPLRFHSPYGCSKGSADQYVLDYARSFGLAAAVFRMSCIYGPHQHGTEDQGWLAHFMIRALEGRAITIYGDGKQVRDALYAEDLVEAFLAAERHLPAIAGEAFNIGGGPDNTLSLLELIDRIADVRGVRPALNFADWRVGDQRWYVSDFAKFRAATGWQPRVRIGEGIGRLYRWLAAGLAEKEPAAAAAQ